MKSMFDWLEGPLASGLSLRGFVQMYARQTETAEEESWSDLMKLGYDRALRLQTGAESGFLDDFAKSSDDFISFPSSKDTDVILREATGHGFACRTLLSDGSEMFYVFKEPCHPPSSPSGDQEKASNPVFSALELDQESCKQLHEAFKDSIPEGWTIYAHHMTICLGSLEDARSNGNPISEDLRTQIRGLKVRERRALRVVSIGRSNGVLAAGVVGCPSVNRVPHITLACARGHKPVESNSILKWQGLTELMALSGSVREFEQRDGRCSKLVSEELVERLKALEAEVLAARAISFSALLASDDSALWRGVEEREEELRALKQDDWQVAKVKVKGKGCDLKWAPKNFKGSKDSKGFKDAFKDAF